VNNLMERKYERTINLYRAILGAPGRHSDTTRCGLLVGISARALPRHRHKLDPKVGGGAT
jgi:hypothetical protein